MHFLNCPHTLTIYTSSAHSCNDCQVVGLIKDPKGEYIFERSNSQPSFMSGNNLDTVDREKMSAMTVRIKELEERLKKHEVMVTRRYE